MCGIFGYIGNRDDAPQMILEGLKLLEYRGYDSWGITVKVGKSLAHEKHVGKIGDTKISLPKSTIGIGHTRWATHGGVTVENAHPHLDCKKEIAVLHNGIVENFQELKQDLLKKGHRFSSQTDTEVIAHLIEDFCKETDFPTAVRQTFNMLHGLNAIVVVNALSSEIVAAKNGSPLVVGIGKNEFFIASDVAGILHHTKEIIFLKDHEMVVLGEKVEIFSLPDGKEIAPKIETITWKIEQAEKGSYKHFLLKEIHEQPKIIRNIAQNYSDQVDDLAEILREAQGTFFIGAGTASYACLAGAYLFSKIAKMHVNTLPASEFNYLEDFLTDKSLIVALSQSGETIDVIEPLTRAKQKGSKIACLVNGLGSTIYRMSDYKMLLGAGPEKAVAATKSYSAKLSLLLMFAYSLANNMEGAEKLLLDAANVIDTLLESKQVAKMQELAKKLSKKEHIYTIGRGVSYPTALEAALKIKEVSYIHAEGLAGGELKHGSLALVEKGTTCIVFAPQDETYEAIISNAIEIKSRGGTIIGISSKNSEAFDEFIEVKHVDSSYILTQIVPVQLLAYFLALEKRLDPDKPRNLAKSVTVK